MQLSDKEQKELKRAVDYLMENDISDTFLVQIIELYGGFKDIETIQARADRIGISYQGVLKTRKVVTIFGQKFVIGKEK